MDNNLINKKFLNALLLIPLGYESMDKIINFFGSYESGWRAQENKLADAGISIKTVSLIIKERSRINPEKELERLSSMNIKMILDNEPTFPELLKEIPSPPRWLYIKGNIAPSEEIVSVVGSRKATSYGKEITSRIIAGLGAKTSITIASGLAMGIDAEAHSSALRHGLKTIALIGSGPDDASIYPKQNAGLAKKIIETGGAIISEYPVGTPPFKQNFIQRNRLISGIAKGVLVTEAAQKSGALITANFALEHGRSVMAVPGPVFSTYSGGTNDLLRQGARIVTSADDVIDELNLPQKEFVATKSNDLTDNEERIIFNNLDYPKSVDELVKMTGVSAPIIISRLSMLELKGTVKNIGNGNWARA